MGGGGSLGRGCRDQKLGPLQETVQRWRADAESRQGAAAGIPAGRAATWAGGRRRGRRCRTLHIVLTAEPKGSEDTSDAAREGGAREASKSIPGLHLRQLPSLI